MSIIGRNDHLNAEAIACVERPQGLKLYVSHLSVTGDDSNGLTPRYAPFLISKRYSSRSHHGS